MRLKKHYWGLKYGLRWWLATSLLPSVPSRHIRTWGLKRMGVDMRGDVMIHRGFHIREPQKITIGSGVSIGPNVLLDGRCGLTIGDSAVIAYEAIVWTLNHDYNDVSFSVKGAPVEIGAYAWLCSRCVIMPGIKIGEGAVVASGAVVTKDVEPYAIVGGVPAKVIGHREKKEYSYGYSSENNCIHMM